MALGLLGLLFLLCIFLSIIGIFFVVLKNGYLLNKKWIFISLVIYCLLLSFINFTAAPSNYLINKLFGILFALCAISSIFFKSNKANYCRLLIGISIIGNMIQLLFFNWVI